MKFFSFAKGTGAVLFLLLQEKYPKEQAKGDPAENAGSPLESPHENYSCQPRGQWQNVGKPSNKAGRALGPGLQKTMQS